MTDLKRLDEWTVEDHLNYKRQHNGSRATPNPDRGRPPRVGEGGPTREEFAEAGLGRRANPNERTAHAYSTALDGGRDAHGQRAIRNHISQLEQELGYATNTQVTGINGVPRFEWIAQLQRRIERQRTELAAATEAQKADDDARRQRAAEADRQERAAGPPPGRAFFGDGEAEWRFDAKGRPVERIGRRGPSGYDEAA